AAALAHDVAPGERVAVLTPNVPESIFAHYAAPLAGTVLVALNTRLTRPEIAQILKHCEARVLLVDTELVERIEGIRDLVPSLVKVVEVNDSVSGLTSSGSATVTASYEAYVPAEAPQPALAWEVADEL